MTHRPFVPLALVALALAPAAAAAQSRPETESPAPPETGLPRKHAPEPTGAAITAGDLMTRLYIFADDSMRGREAGTEGNVKGTDYIAHQIEAMGLEPAGEDGTYFQTIPLETRTLAESSSLSADGKALALGDDWAPLGQRPVEETSLQVVYGGMAGDTAHAISADAAAGKMVVYGVPQGASLGSLFRGRPGPETAAAVAVAGLDQLPPRFRGFLTRPRTFLDEGEESGDRGPALLLVSSAAAEALLGSAPQGLEPGAAGGTATLRVDFDVKPVPYPARNVVGIVRGSDPKLAGEYVAVGAHNDHLGVGRPVDHDSIRIFDRVVRPEGADDGGKQPTAAQQSEVDSVLAAYRKTHDDRMDSVYNGADDDGSGSVTALEIAQAIQAMDPHPKRSVLFVWHVGEEKGLLGSRWFTDHPTVPRDSIVAQLNMDMIGRGDASDETGRTKFGTPFHGDGRYLQLVGSRRLSTELGDLIERVNREDGHDLLFDYSMDTDGHPSNIYCRSDHYEYARYGIPIAFFTTGLHADYHQVTDEPEYIDYDHMARVAKLVKDVAVHVADLDHRPRVDQGKPDPNGRCRQ